MNPTTFIELSKILFITLITTGIIKLLKQPEIIGYILSGIIAGPVFLNIINSTETLATFSQIGIALLLFFVGLNLNPKTIKEVGKISLITGIGQVVFTSGVGFLILKLLGFNTITSIYVAIALSFSSTIVIMKLITDKRELDSLYARISIGFLIVQDFIAIFILLIISSLGNKISLGYMLLETVLKGLAGIVLLFLLSIYVLPKITKVIAKSQEFLLLFSITWCFLVATLFHYLNFSIEVGALLAGMALSMSPYHFEISSRMKPLRDFFLVLFFIVLGSQMTFSNILNYFWIIIGLSLFVLIGNPIIVMVLMGLLGYTKRTSFLAGLTVAQISEFSMILVTMGASADHLSQEIISVVTTIGLITFAGSTYMILYSNKLYSLLSKYLTIFERKGKKIDEHKYHKDEDYEIILFGYNRIGFDILEALKKIRKKFLIIDFNPETIIKLSKQGYNCRYGDANDSVLLDELKFEKVKMVISTIPVLDTNLLIITKVREANPKAIIAVVSHQIEEAKKLYEAGATYVIMPHFLGGKHFAHLIEKNKINRTQFLKERRAQLRDLKRRLELGHRHPKHDDR